MENKLVSLKNNFNKIMDIRSNIEEIFDILRVKIVKLQKMHSDLIHACKTQLFIFGLDSFHFQNKIIDIEYEDMMRYFLAINNRMYCEYFKLHRIIVEYIHKNTKDSKMMEVAKLHKFPPYKDLEPFKEYKMNILNELHEAIIGLLSSMISHVHHKEHELAMHESKMNIGLNIDNFVTTFNYNISIMKEKIMLFVKYMEFFHVLHTKYLQRFSNKIQLMYTHINNDIHLEGNIKENKINEVSTATNATTSTDATTPANSVSDGAISVNSDISIKEHVDIPEKINEIVRLVSASADDIPEVSPPRLSKTKSVNDILKNSIYASMSKSESTEEDIAIYNVFSAIESKCSSIQSNETESVSMESTIADPLPHEENESTPIETTPVKKRRGRKKKES